MTVLGTRPEIIRLSRVIPVLDRYTDHVVVHTGQNYDYELNQVFFDDLELRAPDRYLDAAGQTAAETIGNVIILVDKLIRELQPDAMLILGDTNSCLAALAAKRRKVPIFHMEAGNRCFDMRVPEEINRRIVDHLADINLPYSAISKSYLLREGLPPDQVITTGSPMFEVLSYFMPKIERSDVLTRLGVEADGYFLVSCHREENVDSERNFTGFVETAAPEDLLDVLRGYHDALGQLLPTYQGTLEHFAGDGVMIFFNDPVSLHEHELQAVRFALAAQERFRELRQTWSKRGTELGLGIGIEAGHATLGRIGFEGRYDYGALGPVTNLASRLSTKAMPGQTLIGPRVYAAVDEAVEATPVGALELKGFGRTIPAYAVERVRSPG